MANPITNEIIAQNGVIELNGPFCLQQQDRAQSGFQHLTGEKTISPEAVQRFSQNVRSSAAHCETAGTPYRHIVYPSKAMAFHEAFSAAGVDPVGIFGDAHRQEDVVYPLDGLLARKTTRPVAVTAMISVSQGRPDRIQIHRQANRRIPTKAHNARESATSRICAASPTEGRHGPPIYWSQSQGHAVLELSHAAGKQWTRGALPERSAAGSVTNPAFP